MASPLRAVVFDFDGLIFDSETPIYEASAGALAALGHDLSMEGWSTVVGHGDDDSFLAMERAVGASIDRKAFDLAYAAQDRSWRDQQPALPGVGALLEALAVAEVPCGVASSSPLAWIETHLDRLGLAHHFVTMVGRDRVGGRSKPAPDVYLLACEELAVAPSAAVALEDSAPGIAAARAAGMTVLCVPNQITTHTDLSAAHDRAPSLEAVTPDTLTALLTTHHRAPTTLT